MRKGFVKMLSVGLLALGVVLGSGGALNAQALQQKVEFYLDGKVGAEVVKKGTYTISYPDADQGTLEIKSGKKIISIPFTRQSLDGESPVDKMTYKDNPDGTRSIATIAPRGRKFALVLR